MKLAVDVYYFENNKDYRVSGVLFEEWSSSDPKQTSAITHFSSKELSPYIPGNFKDRELPCIMKLFEEEFDLKNIDTIIIDGYALLGKEGHCINTLGVALHQELRNLGYDQINIIGVAKTKYHDKSLMEYCIPIFRGSAINPIYVSSIGINSKEAASNIKSMHGKNKIPELLKLVDRVSKVGIK